MSPDTGWVERIGHVAPTPPEVARDAGLTIVERFGRSDARPLLDMLGIPDAIAGAAVTTYRVVFDAPKNPRSDPGCR